MAQEAAYILNIKASTTTLEALLDVQKLVAANVQEMKNLKTAANQAEAEFNKLSKTGQELAEKSKKNKEALQAVEKAMKDLLSQNKQASKGYKELKEEKQLLINKDKQLNTQIQANIKALTLQQDKYTKNTEALKQVAKQQQIVKNQSLELGRAVRQEAKEYDALGKKLPKDSLIALEQTLNKQITAWRKLSEEQRNSPFGQKLQRDIQNTDSKVKQLNATIGRFQRNVGNYPSFVNFSKQALSAFGVGSALYVGIAAIQKSINTVREFELALSKFSGITGVVGEDLKRIGEEAIRISGNFGTSTNDLVKTFQLIGELRPELLDTPLLLTKVAEGADTLSKAGLVDVKDSVSALTIAMAAFNLDAEHTDLIINTLASAAQKGAAQIPDLIETMRDAGSTADNAGTTFEEFIALTETLGKGQIKASEAGRILRNVMIKLTQLGRDDLNPIYTEWSVILENLSKEITTAGQAGAIFNVENANGVLTLIKQREEFTRMVGEGGVLGKYNSALELAATNTDNMDGKLKRINTAYENLIITVESGTGIIGGFMGFFLDNATELLNNLAKLEFSLQSISDVGTNFFANPALFLIDELLGSDKKVAAAQKEASENSKKLVYDLVATAKGGRDALVELDAQLGNLSTLGELEKKSIKALQELRKIFKARNPVSEEGQAFIAERIHEIDLLILKKRGRGGDLIGDPNDKDKKSAAGSIEFLNKQISELKKNIQATSDETVIAKTSKEIQALELAVQTLNRALAIAGTEAGSLENINLRKSQLTQDLNETGDETKRISIQLQLDALELQANSIKKSLDIVSNQNAQRSALPSFDKFLGQQLPDFGKERTNIFGRTEEEEAKYQAEQTRLAQEQSDARIAMKEAEDNAILAQQTETNLALQDLITDFGDSITGLFSESEDAQQESFKNLLRGLLKFVEAEVKILALAANTKAAIAAVGNPLLLFKLALQKAIITSLISAAFAALRNIAGFEKGGVVKGDGVPYKRAGSSDDTLIHVKKGEMVLTEQNQRNAENLYGKGVWGSVGVNGFRNAAANNVIKIANNGNTSANIDSKNMHQFAEMVSDKVALAVIDTTRNNRIYERTSLIKAK